MKAIKIVLGIVAFIIAVIIGAFVFYGGFKTVSAEKIECGGETLVYKKMTGDYAQSGTVSTQVYQKLKEDYGIETTKGFGIFYDNPKTVQKDALRSDVGCILDSNFDKLEALKSNFEVSQYPIKDYLVAEFPYKGMPSIILGVMKVYPTLNDYTDENGYELDTPVMEIWDIPNKKITYRKQLIKRVEI